MNKFKPINYSVGAFHAKPLPTQGVMIFSNINSLCCDFAIALGEHLIVWHGLSKNLCRNNPRKFVNSDEKWYYKVCRKPDNSLRQDLHPDGDIQRHTDGYKTKGVHRLFLRE